MAKITLAGALFESIQNVIYANITNMMDGVMNILEKKFGDLLKVINIWTPEQNPVGSVFHRTATSELYLRVNYHVRNPYSLVMPNLLTQFRVAVSLNSF